MPDYNPTIVTFVCNWCSYAGADKAGGQKLEYSANIKLVRVMCSGRVDPQFILDSLRRGADGVLVLGCHLGDCHYRSGNYKTMCRMKLLTRVLEQFGIHPHRIRLDWVGAGESERFQKIANQMAETVKKLGPLKLSGFVKTGGIK